MKALPGKSEFLIYEAENGAIKLDVRFEGETVWLTQQLMADLFQTTKQNVGQHLKNIFEEQELAQPAVVKNFFTTATDGKNYSTNFYNLDAITSVGYRIKSRVATQFRIWATSLDYDATSETSLSFFKTVQNKVHWAITGQTAAEIIHARADCKQSNMGLTNWRGAKPRKEDTIIAKNYLDEAELAALNNLVEQYLVFAEGQAMRRIAMRMGDWVAKLDGFPRLNERDILTHAGRISHEDAVDRATQGYGAFDSKRLAEKAAQPDDFDKAVRQLPTAKPARKKKRGAP